MQSMQLNHQLRSDENRGIHPFHRMHVSRPLTAYTAPTAAVDRRAATCTSCVAHRLTRRKRPKRRPR